MKTYIALLRGINVSGQKLIKMEVLRKILQELDFENIRTYIQSGNIIFESKISDRRKLEKQIHDTIETHFGFQVPVVIVTPEELKNVTVKNPYPDHQAIDATQPYVAFLSDIPSNEAIEVFKAVDFGKDQYTINDNTVYLLYADSAGKSKLTNVALENKLKVKATSRNWKTILKLIAMSEIKD